MPNDNSRDVFELARSYRKIAAKIDDYVSDNYHQLTVHERFALLRKEGALEQAALQLSLESSLELLEGLGDDLETIRSATKSLNAAIDRLDAIEDVVEATSHAVQFVAALIAQNYPGAAGHAVALGKSAAALAGADSNQSGG